MKYAIICIFTHSGRTYTFRDIEILTNNESFLCFRYSAMSDNLVKVANFPKTGICGWSTTELEEVF